MVAFKKEIEKRLRYLQEYIDTLDDNAKRLSVAYVIANLLSENFNDDSALGLIERIKQLLLTEFPEEDVSYIR